MAQVYTNNDTFSRIPHNWFSEVLTDSGKPDHVGMNLLAEIQYWYSPDKNGKSRFPGDKWQTSYNNLIKKFNDVYKRHTIFRALDRLEEAGFINRELRTITKYGHKYPNVLFIGLIKLPSIDKPIVKTNDYNSKKEISTVYQKVDVSILPEASPRDLVLGSDNLPHDSEGYHYNDADFSTSNASPEATHFFETEKEKKNFYHLTVRGEYNSVRPSLQICNDLYKELENKEENIKNRSNQRASAQSNFNVLLYDEEIQNSQTSWAANKASETTASKNQEKKHYKGKTWSIDWKERKSLSELASTITEKEAEQYNKEAGREFNTNFVIQLALKRGKESPDYFFDCKKQFQNYIVKALAGELLQASQANRIGFKYRCNMTEEEKIEAKELSKRNKYLNEIEDSTSTKPEMLLHKKVLARLGNNIAYEIFKKTSFSIENAYKEKGIVEANEVANEKKELLKALHIKVLQSLNMEDNSQEISDKVKEIILEEARIIYGNSLQEIIVHAKQKSSGYQRSPVEKENKHPGVCSKIEKMWNEVSKGLKAFYGKVEFLKWFENLQILGEREETSKCGEVEKVITIKAPTQFAKERLTNNYKSSIKREFEKLCSGLLNIEFVCHS